MVSCMNDGAWANSLAWSVITYNIIIIILFGSPMSLY